MVAQVCPCVHAGVSSTRATLPKSERPTLNPPRCKAYVDLQLGPRRGWHVESGSVELIQLGNIVATLSTFSIPCVCQEHDKLSAESMSTDIHPDAEVFD